ncbi:uncharacterized protein MAL13P1.304-like [Condylostylus longicornis]|uniref:uncharacterized protein MAL13P1.304-like n=1 Tax=Condylostylus longicornis TaxID=2530218 RepID=UPI00244E4C67|nr:uncharacterized protein MAL13P1.304-like [Condylostylus longicornis]
MALNSDNTNNNNNNNNNQFTLTVSDLLRDATRIHEFRGGDDYALSSFLREVDTILPLFNSNPDLKQYVFQRTIINKIPEPDLEVIRTLGPDATWDNMKEILVNNFGVKETYHQLYQEALSIKVQSVSSVSEVFNKLKVILGKLNEKYEFDVNKPKEFSPKTNESSLREAYNTLTSSNLIRERNSNNNYGNRNRYLGHSNNSGQTIFNRSNNNNHANNYNNNNNSSNNSGRTRFNNNYRANHQEPMEVDHIQDHNKLPRYKRYNIKKPIPFSTINGTIYVNKEIKTNLPLEFNEDAEMIWKLVKFDNKDFHGIIDYSSISNNDFENLKKSLNSEEKTHLNKLLNNYSDLFFKEGDYLTNTTEIQHQIITTIDRPIYFKIYRYPQIHEKEISKQISDMLKQGIIKESNSPYNSSLWIVQKKADSSGQKKWRIVIDYRKLNEVTVDDKFPIPNIETILDQLRRTQYFTTLDLAKGFHQILVREEDKKKTAFSTPQGHYENNQTIIEKLREYKSQRGYFKKLVTDNEFRNVNIKDFLRKENIELHLVKPNSHTGNSNIERLHNKLSGKIRMLGIENEDLNIQEKIFRVSEWYSNSYHSTTREKPINIQEDDRVEGYIKNYKTVRHKEQPKYKKHALDNIHSSTIKRKSKFSDKINLQNAIADNNTDILPGTSNSRKN